MALQFGVSYAGGRFEYVRVRRWPFRIGRSPKNDLCLANSTRISRQHAKILSSDEGYQIIALGRNPSYLNGELIPPNVPHVVEPGDVIEFPDYRLEVRDTALPARATETVHVQAVSNSAIIVRRVASTLGIPRWTVEEIHRWLGEERGREIWIRHEHVELRLGGAFTSRELATRLELVDQLLTRVDPHEVVVEIVDPFKATGQLT